MAHRSFDNTFRALTKQQLEAPSSSHGERRGLLLVLVNMGGMSFGSVPWVSDHLLCFLLALVTRLAHEEAARAEKIGAVHVWMSMLCYRVM